MPKTKPISVEEPAMKLSTLLTLALAAALSSCGGSVNGGKRTVIQNKGSDTLVNVAQTWAEEYRKIHPDCAVAVSGGGSGTGIAAMINGTVDIANSSREMKEREMKMARDNGNEPVPFIVGYDALAIFVHKDNPIESITIEELAAIYGEGGEITSWSQLGITVPGAARDEMVRVSRQNNSGTYAYFREAVLGREGNYKLGSLDMHGSKDVVELVQNTRSAIGYSGLAYATDHVKMLKIAKADGETAYAPSVENTLSKAYPIARPLFMYTLGKPVGKLKAYLDWCMSPQGQKIVESSGYVSVPSGPNTAPGHPGNP